MTNAHLINFTLQELNNVLSSKRKVRKTLFEQPNVRAFERSLAQK